MKKNKLLKLNFATIIILNSMYVFRGIYNIFFPFEFVYFLTVVMIFINSLSMLVISKKINKIVLVILLISTPLLLYSLLLNSLLVTLIGYLAIFLNLLYWVFLFSSLDQKNLRKLFNWLIKLNVYFAMFSAIIGIYQYFWDPSIFGLAISRVYGDRDLIESGIVFRRATAFFGTPTNYSFYLLVFLPFVPVAFKSKLIGLMYMIIILIGGIVSASRAFSIGLIILVMAYFIHTFLTIKKNRFRSNFSLGVILSCLVISITLFGIYLEPFSRLFNIFQENYTWLAYDIYVSHIKTLELINLPLGNGLGYNERLVSQFLNIRYTSSFESFVLSLLFQTGLLGLISFLSLYLSSVLLCHYRKNSLYFAILISILINLFISPAFNGLTISYILWPLILFPLFIRQNHNIEPIILNSEDDSFESI